MHLTDIFGFILDHHDDVQTSLQVVGDLTMPEKFAQIHFSLFSLSLFSPAM
jgi:hypothetical protein